MDHPLPRWYDYLAATLVPPFAIIAGIVTMSRNQIGPGFALWATGFLGFWIVWPILLMMLGVLAS